MITSRVSPALKLYGVPGMPRTPGGTSVGRGSCVTWHCEADAFTGLFANQT